jgi:hypothetical protein
MSGVGHGRSRLAGDVSLKERVHPAGEHERQVVLDPYQALELRDPVKPPGNPPRIAWSLLGPEQPTTTISRHRGVRGGVRARRRLDAPELLANVANSVVYVNGVRAVNRREMVGDATSRSCQGSV